MQRAKKKGNAEPWRTQISAVGHRLAKKGMRTPKYSTVQMLEKSDPAMVEEFIRRLTGRDRKFMKKAQKKIAKSQEWKAEYRVWEAEQMAKRRSLAAAADVARSETPTASLPPSPRNENVVHWHNPVRMPGQESARLVGAIPDLMSSSSEDEAAAQRFSVPPRRGGMGLIGPRNVVHPSQVGINRSRNRPPSPHPGEIVQPAPPQSEDDFIARWQRLAAQRAETAYGRQPAFQRVETTEDRQLAAQRAGIKEGKQSAHTASRDEAERLKRKREDEGNGGWEVAPEDYRRLFEEPAQQRGWGIGQAFTGAHGGLSTLEEAGSSRFGRGGPRERPDSSSSDEYKSDA